jgi:hypothetical protein
VEFRDTLGTSGNFSAKLLIALATSFTLLDPQITIISRLARQSHASTGRPFNGGAERIGGIRLRDLGNRSG